ncbi:hypothetical protein WJX79_005823 [Trebouxia sp. C0005]
MQARQHKAQSGKGALPSGAPLAFQLSSPSKIAKRNVLDAPAPKTLVSDALAGIAEDNATASGKVRPKKSRWGPDQPTGSPILPVASSEAAAASQVTTHHSPSTLDVSSGHYPQPDRLHHISSGDVHMASSKGRYSRSPTRDLSQVPSTELLRPFSRERSQSPSRTGVMPRDQMRVSIRENGYPREHFKGPGRNGKDCTDYARHDIAQNKRPRYNCHYQEYYEYDRGPVHSTDHDQMAATRREHDSCLASQTVPYVKQHDFSRRNDRSHRSSHRQPQRSRSHSMAPGGGPSGDRRKQERQARRRSPSHEEEGQITDRPATRSPILGKDAPKLPGQQLNRSPGQVQPQKALVIVNDQRNQSDPDQAIPSSPRAKPVQRSSGEGRCRSLDKAAQQSPRTMRGRSRQAVEPHTQPCRVHRQCEDALPLSAHVLDRKRSQTPDTQTDRYAKRSRNDQRQPVVSSSQARVHGSRRAPPPSFREKQISSVEARRQASKLATLRPGEPRESNHSVSTRSRQHAVLPNDAYANRPSSESREPSVSMSPSPVHKRALQPHGPHPNRGQGGPAAPHLDDWQSDRWHNGDRDVVQGPGRLPSDLRQHARVRAQKLDWDTDQMMAKLLGAYGKPAEAIGDRQVLEAMREAVRVIGNMDEDNREASPGFLVTRQDLPEWLPDAKKQQVLNMLFPAAWLHQDPDFQPQWKLPLGWEPPECAGDGLRPHAEPLDSALQEGLQQVSHLQTNTVTVLLSREEAEAGGPGLDNSRDPRRRACSARPAQSLLLPMPLFPFLPHVEENICDSSSTSPDVIEGRTGGATAGPVDQLAPGGFLYDLWDMRHRAASPAGSWSTTPHTMASAGWGEARRPESASEWATSGHLEPPAAPSHTTNTEQQYTDHITTTAQPQWPPHEDSTGQQHGNMFEVQQQPHWQQQQDEAITPAAPSRVPTLQAPSAPQLQRPAYYPDPEPADYHIQFCDHMGLRTWSLATLRQDMRCGKGDALPNTPILNKAEGYWLPLREGRWLPDHLHWAGIDQMLSLAVMSGVAGKSLIKEVLDRAIQQELDKAKVCSYQMLA